MTEQRHGSFFQGIEEWLARLIGGTIGLLLGLMVIIVFSNVIARYFLNSSLAWSEEISRFMLIWLAFLGSYLAFVKDEHLGLDLLVFLPPKVAIVIRAVAGFFVIIALGVILYGGWSITTHTLSSGWTSPALSIPYGFVYAVVPICGALLLLQAFFKFGRAIKAVIREFTGRP